MHQTPSRAPHSHIPSLLISPFKLCSLIIALSTSHRPPLQPYTSHHSSLLEKSLGI
jgi:hypothetical protein